MNSVNYVQLINIDPQKHRRIAVVGSGGKTSLIFRLAEELKATGRKVIVTTTTHMAYDRTRSYAEAGDWEKLKYNLENYGYTVTAVLEKEKGKIASPSGKILNQLKEHCDTLLTEADGAKCLPLKVPENWEPVIPSWTDLVIGVLGLDSLEKKIAGTAHRPDKVAAFLGKNVSDKVVPEDLVKIASSVNGLRKDAENRDYRVYLNKVDVLEKPEVAETICRKLKEREIFAVYGSIRHEIKRTVR